MTDKARVFIDTNVFLYLLSADAAKADIVEALLTDASCVRAVSVQVVDEFVNVARNKARLDWSEIREYVALLRDACEIAPITDQEQDMALEIAERYRYRWYDSLIIASAVASGASLLLSEDLHDGQSIGDLVIQNPFGKEAPVS